jgi:aryl-phospho-beta-D-glucosidase BglC (GH1 family)
MDKIIAECDRLGLKVVLDNHSRKADGYMNETLWYTSGCSEEKWINDWVTIVTRYKNNPSVVGADLNNEPHGKVL